MHFLTIIKKGGDCFIGKKKYTLDALSPTFADNMMHRNKPYIRAGQNIPEKMTQEVENSGFYMGLETKCGKGYYVGKKSEDDGNVLIIGINGSGKSHYLAKSIIETWHDPFVVLDCKGELWQRYRFLQRQGRTTRPFILFDPINEDIHYDPFAILREDSIHFVENVREIVYALIPKPPSDTNNYWNNMARDLLSAIIIYGFSIGLDFIETMIIAVNFSVPELCQKINQFNSEPNAKLAKMFLSEIPRLKPEQQADIGSDLKQHLMVFATDQCIQNALSSSDNTKTFSWVNITTATENPNIFLCLNQNRLEQWSSVTQLILTQLIRTLERRPDKQTPQGRNIEPILLLLDEFPLLGKIDAITNALTTLRSKKVTFCLMIQSIAQLDVIYGHDVRKIIVDNCQYKVFLKITEPDSQEYFSRLIGTIPIGRRSVSQSYDPYINYTTFSGQIQEVREPLILPHEFAFNEDIWLHTPYGFLSTIKLPVENTHQHVVDFEKTIRLYHELQERRKSNDYR